MTNLFAQEGNGIKIHVRGKEIDLNEINPKDLEAMLDELTDEEADAINDEIVAQIGQEQMDAIVAEVMEAEDDEPIHQVGDCKDEPVVDPIFLDVPVGLTHDLEELADGINDASYFSGQFTAYVNSGMTVKQAYDLVVMQLRHAQDLEMFDKQAQLQRDIKEKEVKMQLQINGLKQLLTEE